MNIKFCNRARDSHAVTFFPLLNEERVVAAAAAARCGLGDGDLG